MAATSQVPLPLADERAQSRLRLVSYHALTSTKRRCFFKKADPHFEVIAAAKRLGDHDLEQQIVKHVFKGYANPVSFVQGREVGLPRRRP